MNDTRSAEAATAPQDEAVRPFTLAISEDQLDDLRRRLDSVRWPDEEQVDDWSQGAPLAKVKALADHWRNAYDWRRCETMLNDFGQFTTTIDGVDIHFLHVRSKNPDALPLLLSHGWPGSVIEFAKCVRPLSDPEAHGGDPADAFHLVIPSLPGYGFSGKPRETGWNIQKIARTWHKLMTRLGYDRYVAQGGDWGAGITTALGAQRPEGLAGVHVNLPMVLPRDIPAELSTEEKAMLDALAHYNAWESGYSIQQATRPQTLGYGLADSPVAQAAWIIEKFHAWTDHDGNLPATVTRDDMLDNVMLYWLTNSGTSSARLYWESSVVAFSGARIELPAGCSVFPNELYRAPRSWCESHMPNLIHWNELDRGGHFAAFEVPDLFISEVRSCFGKLRSSGFAA